MSDQQTNEPAANHWHVLWTRSHCEQVVCEQLTAKGFHTFLPKINMWSRRNGLRQFTRTPMFPGYLFLHHVIDRASYIEVRKVQGLVGILGERWDRLAVVPEPEIEAIQTMMQSSLPVLPHPYLREGQRVRITHGPLADIEGILEHIKSNKGRLVLSVDLLRQSVAVEIDCTVVRPV